MWEYDRIEEEAEEEVDDDDDDDDNFQENIHTSLQTHIHKTHIHLTASYWLQKLVFVIY